MVTAAAAAMLMVPLLGTNQGTNTNLTVMSFYGTDIAEAGWLTLAMYVLCGAGPGHPWP